VRPVSSTVSGMASVCDRTLEFGSDRTHRRVSPVMLTYVDARSFWLWHATREGPNTGQRHVTRRVLEEFSRSDQMPLWWHVLSFPRSIRSQCWACGHAGKRTWRRARLVVDWRVRSLLTTRRKALNRWRLGGHGLNARHMADIC
jgi:hypothetical protein